MFNQFKGTTMVASAKKLDEKVPVNRPTKATSENSTLDFMIQLVELQSLGVASIKMKEGEPNPDLLLDIATYGGCFELAIDDLGVVELYGVAQLHQSILGTSLTSAIERVNGLMHCLAQLNDNLKLMQPRLYLQLNPLLRTMIRQCMRALDLPRVKAAEQSIEKLCNQLCTRAMLLARIIDPDLDFDLAVNLAEECLDNLQAMSDNNTVRYQCVDDDSFFYRLHTKISVIPFGDALKLWELEQGLEKIPASTGNLAGLRNEYWDICRDLQSASFDWLEEMRQKLSGLNYLPGRDMSFRVRFYEQLKTHLGAYESQYWKA